MDEEEELERVNFAARIYRQYDPKFNLTYDQDALSKLSVSERIKQYKELADWIEHELNKNFGITIRIT